MFLASEPSLQPWRKHLKASFYHSSLIACHLLFDRFSINNPAKIGGDLFLLFSFEKLNENRVFTHSISPYHWTYIVSRSNRTLAITFVHSADS